MFKSLILALALVFVPLAGAWAAYTTTFKMLDKKEVVKLEDESLTDAYMDTLVEVEVRKSFFNRFGFVGKDLEDFRAIMKYRLVLLMEIHSRNLDLPQFERY